MSARRKIEVGHTVLGTHAGKTIQGIVVCIHGGLLGVSHEHKLIGDLDPQHFTHAEPAEPAEKIAAKPDK